MTKGLLPSDVVLVWRYDRFARSLPALVKALAIKSRSMISGFRTTEKRGLWDQASELERLDACLLIACQSPPHNGACIDRFVIRH